MTTLFFSPSKTTPALPPFSSQTAFSESMMEENIDTAQSLITKWDPTSSSKLTFLFLSNRREAREFIRCVKDLRRAMDFYVSENPNSHKLTLAQNLMQIAMKRLEKEFYQILSANRDQLEPDSVSGRSSTSADEYDVASDDEELERDSASATSDLKAIADCMITSGYGNECVKIYKVIRKSIVDEGLYGLGIVRPRSSQVHKMDKVVLEQKIKNWLSAMRIAVKTLFNGERILCDHVFSASDSIRESCFAHISKEGAINVFRFAVVVAKSKRSTDIIFRLMDMYEAISELWPEIELTFSFDSTSTIRSQVMSSLFKLGDSVRTALSEFESRIQKDSSKTPVAGGGIHPLTRSTMDYISMLADYSPVLSDIVADWPPPAKSPLPESYFDSPTSGESPTTAVSVRLAWLILVLLCKLDNKAKLYKDVSLSYLFLANNLHFIVNKVRTTCLRHLLGDDWVINHHRKVKQYASNYETMAWSKVLSSLPENNSPSPEAAKECFRRFNEAFEEAYRKQTTWVVPDGRLRDEMKVSIARKLVNTYSEFYETNVVMLSGESNLEGLVRIGPDDLGNYLSDLFHGTSLSGNSTSSSWSWSVSSSSRKLGIQPR